MIPIKQYEQLESVVPDLKIKKLVMPDGLSGLYYKNEIHINKKLNYPQSVEVLSEEIGHYYTSTGDITDYSNIQSVKQELKARRFGYELVVTLDGLVEAFQQAIKTIHELADFFDVSAEYINKAISHYQNKYGNFTYHGPYLIYFIPNLRVIKYMDV